MHRRGYNEQESAVLNNRSINETCCTAPQIVAKLIMLRWFRRESRIGTLSNHRTRLLLFLRHTAIPVRNVPSQSVNVSIAAMKAFVKGQ